VNLAAEFPKTPFDGPFSQLQAAVAEKQAFETLMIKQFITDFRSFPEADDPETRQAFEIMTRKLLARHGRLEQAVRARLVPVKHSLAIEAVR